MSEMNTIYSTATVCLLDDPHNCQTLEPGIFARREKRLLQLPAASWQSYIRDYEFRINIFTYL